MKKDYKELVEFLDGKFTKIEKKLDNLEENKADKEVADKILDSQDKIITKLDKLLQEKTIGDVQDKRKTKVLEIHNDALKNNKILSDNQVAQIKELRVF